MFEIDTTSSKPIYSQIADNIILMIEEGTLKKGERLPPIRKLANEIGIAINTVAHAYQELEQKNYISSNGRRGSIVVRDKTEEATGLEKHFKAPIIACIRRGLERDEIRSVFDSALEIFFD